MSPATAVPVADIVTAIRKGTFGSCFEVSEIIKIVSQNTSKYLTAWLVSIVGAIVIGIIVAIASVVLALIVCIGWILMWVISALSSVYLFTMYAHLFGQVLAKDTANLVTTD